MMQKYGGSAETLNLNFLSIFNSDCYTITLWLTNMVSMLVINHC